jgi:hypothetical protein
MSNNLPKPETHRRVIDDINQVVQQDGDVTFGNYFVLVIIQDREERARANLKGYPVVGTKLAIPYSEEVTREELVKTIDYIKGRATR